jgi:hypothetical protein
LTARGTPFLYYGEDEGEYVGMDTMTRPELLALFPPMPEGFDFGALGLEPMAMATAASTTVRSRRS